MKKKIIGVTLAVVLTMSQLVSVGAAKEDEIRAAKEQTNSELAATNSRINEIEEEKTALQAEINQLDQELVDVLVQIGVLEDEITDKEAAIKQTKADLVVAEEDRDDQYEAMKKRIQYMYENGGNEAWIQILAEADSISSLLTKVEYSQQLYDYDRDSLEKLKEIVQQVTDLGNQLETEKAELETMQDEYEVQQATLETTLETKKATASDYESQLATAQAQAAEYQQLIEEQTAELQKIEEEKQRAAEAAEAAAQAAAEEAAAQAASEEAAYDSDGDTSSSVSSGSSSSDSGSSSSSASGSGSAVVSYATQFVGNPYVWGGTSLTNGTDCSGFTQGVYAHFGISIPRTSGAQRSAGRGVSYSEAQPGDLICYSGHVAIYMGNGQIVHASNAKDGIKISGNAAYRTIVAVRRLV